MNRSRFLAIAAAFAFAVPAIAQQSGQQSAPAPAHHMPTADDHLKVLSEKLNLTADQQEKARPILKEMMDSMQKVMSDDSLTPAEKHAQMRPAHEKADKALREFLTDEQKKTLTEMEAEHHHMPAHH